MTCSRMRAVYRPRHGEGPVRPASPSFRQGSGRFPAPYPLLETVGEDQVGLPLYRPQVGTAPARTSQQVVRRQVGGIGLAHTRPAGWGFTPGPGQRAEHVGDPRVAAVELAAGLVPP